MVELTFDDRQPATYTLDTDSDYSTEETEELFESDYSQFYDESALALDEPRMLYSYAIRRLYEGRSQRVTKIDRDVIGVGVSDLVFSALPALSFFLAIAGMVMLIWSISAEKFAYLLPSLICVIGFSSIGMLSIYLSKMMQTHLKKRGI